MKLRSRKKVTPSSSHSAVALDSNTSSSSNDPTTRLSGILQKFFSLLPQQQQQQKQQYLVQIGKRIPSDFLKNLAHILHVLYSSLYVERNALK